MDDEPDACVAIIQVKAVNKYLARATKQLNWVEQRAMHRASAEKESLHVPEMDPSGGDMLLTKVPVDFYEETQFFVNVSVGTPRQTRTVILDTGSSVFGIFCDPPPKAGDAQEGRSHIYLPHFIPAGLLEVWAKARDGGGGGGAAVWAVGGSLGMALGVLLVVRRQRGFFFGGGRLAGASGGHDNAV